MPPGRVVCLTADVVVVFFLGVILSRARIAAFRADRTNDAPALRRLRRREFFLSRVEVDLSEWKSRGPEINNTTNFFRDF